MSITRCRRNLFQCNMGQIEFAIIAYRLVFIPIPRQRSEASRKMVLKSYVHLCIEGKHLNR